MDPHLVTDYLMSLARGLPQVLAAFVGMILAFVFWRRCPTSALLVLLASLLAVVTEFVFRALFIWLPDAVEHGESMNTLFRVLEVGWNVAGTITFVLLLLAAFAGRKPMSAAPQPFGP